MKATNLNNRRLRAIRKTEAYEAVMLDLYLIGALSKEVVEKLIGCTIPDHLTNPITDTKPEPTVVELEVCEACGLPKDEAFIPSEDSDADCCEACGLLLEREITE